MTVFGRVKDLQAIVAALVAEDPKPSVLATLVSVSGSSYRRPGARLLIAADKERTGSISGGCLEEDVMARAARVSATGQADAVVYDTTSENDLVWGVGLGCHGIVRVLLEKLPPRPPWATVLAENFARRRRTALAILHGGDSTQSWGTRLAAPGDCADPDALFLETISPPTALTIFGAGDDAQPLVRLAKELGWYVTVMTHHYVHDLPLLRALLDRPLAYLGLLGPRKRADKLCDDLRTAGLTLSAEQRAQLHAPVGLDLGADGPEQVALAIVAEMQAVLTGRNARPLRERDLPIHD